jgi:glutathione S-transferase
MTRPMTCKMIVIPPSHYCEKARWALRLAGVSFTEEAHPPMFHVRAVRRAGGQRTTPTLVTPDGVFGDSTAIMGWLQGLPGARWRPYGEEEALAQEVKEWERYLGEQLGPHTRRYAYSHLLPLPRALSLPCLTHGAPAREARLTALLWPLIRWVMRTSMKITPEGAARSQVKIEACFDRVAGALREGEGLKAYLVGDRLSVADVTFATLAAPVLMVEGYGALLPEWGQLPEALRAQVSLYRAHPAGQFALKVYEELKGGTLSASAG